MGLSSYLKYLIFVLLATVFIGCGNTRGIIYTIDDLSGARIAVLDKSVDDMEFDALFPELKPMATFLQ